MRHSDHVALLREAVPQGGLWADLGSGEGAFTLALADLIGAKGHLWSIDRDASALRIQQQAEDQPLSRSYSVPGVLIEVQCAPPSVVRWIAPRTVA